MRRPQQEEGQPRCRFLSDSGKPPQAGNQAIDNHFNVVLVTFVQFWWKIQFNGLSIDNSAYISLGMQFTD